MGIIKIKYPEVICNHAFASTYSILFVSWKIIILPIIYILEFSEKKSKWECKSLTFTSIQQLNFFVAFNEIIGSIFVNNR